MSHRGLLLLFCSSLRAISSRFILILPLGIQLKMSLTRPTKPLGRKIIDRIIIIAKPKLRNSWKSRNKVSMSISTPAPRIGPHFEPLPPTTIIDNKNNSSDKENISGPMVRWMPAYTPPASPVNMPETANTNNWNLIRLTPRASAQVRLSRKAVKVAPIGLYIVKKAKIVPKTRRVSDK